LHISAPDKSTHIMCVMLGVDSTAYRIQATVSGKIC